MEIKPNTKFWFGNNPELVKKFKVIAEKLTGKACVEGIPDEDICALFYNKNSPNWTYLGDERMYFVNSKKIEVAPMSFFTWKTILGGLK